MSDAVAVLVLILIANAAPVLASYLFKHRSSIPVDFGYRLSDGYLLFGQTKTWRGIVAALLLTSICSGFIFNEIWTGVIVSVTAMAGDLLSSFIKRRIGLESSSRAIFLDQLPESLLPAAVIGLMLSLSLMQIIAIAISFIILEVVFSKIFYQLGVRKRPY